jgi:tRNA nucleotidyltransferase (CCA-adding enzyme)
MIDAIRALPGGTLALERIDLEPGVYLVGGAVRDLLLGRSPRELDLVTEGDVGQLAARLGGAERVHDRFGTRTVTVDGFTYDLARARRETYPHAGALPLVAPASLAEDLLRRDFTVNALAIALTGDAAGGMIAPPGALADLEGGRLRVLHDQSFRDDPTRLVRLARYSVRLGFAVEPHTGTLARQAVAAAALDKVSGTRVGNELRLLAREADPFAGLVMLEELEIAAAISAALHSPDGALAAGALDLLPADGRRDLLALALAFEGGDAAELRTELDRLAFEADDRDAIVSAAAGARSLAAALGSANTPSAIAATVGSAGPEAVAIAGALGPTGPAREWLTRLRHVALEIDGADLLGAGVPEGPGIGVGLRAALAAKLDGRVAGWGQELAEAVRAAGEGG